MDHNEATRSLERLFEKEANRAQEAVTELEALVLHLPEKPRQQAQIKARVSTLNLYVPPRSYFLAESSHQRVANTIVQLIRRSTSGVIAAMRWVPA